jgi:digeranylgeranylglycerophospholipid reductase
MIKREYDIIVVGAGPAGSMAAKFAAEKGVSVLMLEKDRDVGYPVRCGEAVSKKGIEQFINPDEKWIASHINKFSFNAPDGEESVIEFSDSGYILERRIFDYELAKSAAEAGAQILTRSYVNGLIFENDRVSGVQYEFQGEQKKVKCMIVIGADGVESRIGRWAGLKTYTDFRDMECCTQITASHISVQPDTLYFYFGKDYAPGGYFWIFPKGKNIANIGLGISGLIGKKRSALSFLNEFMEKHYPDAPVLTRIAGGVPSTVTLKKIVSQGIMLAGDAAHQVNPLSGGGITSGMIAGSIAGRIAAEAVKLNRPDHIFNYENEWYERVGKKHEIYNRLKNGIYNFSDEKFNAIAKSFNLIPNGKRTLGRLFVTALFNHPSLIADVAKVFII